MLKLCLPKGKVIWALAHPVSKDYIHEVDGTGYQDCHLIVTEDSQPVDTNLEDYPQWAQTMIITSLNNGSLINKGEALVKKKESEGSTNPASEPKDSEVKKTAKKTKVKRSKKKDKE